jgi:hypothetical protein
MDLLWLMRRAGGFLMGEKCVKYSCKKITNKIKMIRVGDSVALRGSEFGLDN